MRTLLVAALLLGLLAADALADAPPPQGVKPMTDLLQNIERSADFGYFDEAEYYTKMGNYPPFSGRWAVAVRP